MTDQQYILPIIPATTLNNSEPSQRYLMERIQELKKKKNAVILCHNYQKPEVHWVADFVGDSYGLCADVGRLSADIIVFCGVRFMAETAHILNPEKKVLLPEAMAGCALADEISGPQLRDWKAQYPDASVVMYINCSSEVKAQCDAICTSSNALHVVNAMPSQTVLFGPDANLGDFVSKQSTKNIIVWPGYCPVHKAMTVDMLQATMAKYPDAVVIVHPECNPNVSELADEVLSTTQMLEAIEKRPEKRFIVGTEIGLIQKAQIMFPGKEIHPIYAHRSCDQSCACPFMKMTSLESVYQCLLAEQHVISVPENIRNKALKSVHRMLDIGLPPRNISAPQTR